MVTNLTTQEFKEKVFAFDIEKEWKFKGDKPAIIKFSAEWCAPCKMLTPILEKLSEEYDGKIDIYKVDVDEATELAQAFQIRSVPSMLFIPMEGQPEMAMGALPPEEIKKAIVTTLKIN
jgi:thioredoxin